MPGLRVGGAVALWIALLVLVASPIAALPAALAADFTQRRSPASPATAEAPTLDYLASIGGGVETVEVVGPRAYINEGNTFTILDIADPSQPALVGSYTAAHHIEAIAVAGNRAFVGTRDGLLILDITTPSAPQLLATHRPDAPSQSGAAPYWVRDIQLLGQRAYVLNTNGIDVLDVAVPASPLTLATGSTYFMSIPRAFEVVDDMAYVATGDHLSQLRRADLHDLQQIDWLQSPINALGSYRDVDVAGQYAFVASDSAGLVVLSTTEPVNDLMAYLDIPHGATAIAVSGGRAYLTAGSIEGTGTIVDIDDPFHPVKLGEFDTPGTANDIVVSANKAYIADGPGGLQILDISVPSAVKQLGTYKAWQAYAVDAAGDRAFVAAKLAGLRIVDVSNPQRPVVAGSYQSIGSVVDVQVADNLAYVLEWPVKDGATGNWAGGGLLVIDVSRSSEPRLLARFDGFKVPSDIQLHHQRAYIAADEGFFILDTADPYNPVLVGSYKPPATFIAYEDLAVENGRAFLTRTDWETSLTILDLSNEQAPSLLAVHNFADVRDIKVAAGRVFLTAYRDYDDTLLVLDVGVPSTYRELAAVGGAGSEPSELELKGDLAFVPSNWSFGVSGRLGVVDISDPANPQSVGGYDAQTRILDSAFANRHLFLATENGGLEIVQTNLPADPATPTSTPVPPRPPSPSPSQPPLPSPGAPQAGQQYRIMVPYAGR